MSLQGVEMPTVAQMFLAWAFLPGLINTPADDVTPLPDHVAQAFSYRVKDQTNSPVCGPDIPAYDSGLDGRGVKILFPDMIRMVAKNTDLIVLGDTHHNNADVRGIASKEDNMVALANAGVSDIFIEYNQDLQPLADDLAAGEISRDKFTVEFDKHYHNVQGNEKGQVTSQVADMIQKGSELGIHIHFANPENGQEAIRNLRKESERLDHDVLLAMWDETYEGKKIDFENRKNDITRRVKAAAIDRFDDQQLAAFINQTAKGKSVLIYGAGHGSRFGDFEKHLQMSVMKVNLFANPGMVKATEKLLKGMNSEGIALGEEKADLVYFIDNGTVQTTCNTPPELARDLEKAAPSFKEPPGTPAKSIPLQAPTLTM
jgi:hypothetical protein